MKTLVEVAAALIGIVVLAFGICVFWFCRLTRELEDDLENEK